MTYTIHSDSPYVVDQAPSEAPGNAQHFNFDPTPRVTVPATSSRD